MPKKLLPVVLLLLAFGSFLFVRCGSSFDAFLAPFSGFLSVDGGTPSYFTWSNVRIEIGGPTTAITLSNTVAGNQGFNQVSTLKLVVPNDMIGNETDLGTTPGSTSTMTETTVNSVGQTVSTEFKSTTVEGSAFIQSLTPTIVQGNIEALFTDADGNTREFTDGSFTYNQ